MENYIVINGKKSELTEEQLEKLGIKIKSTSFERKINENYYCINSDGKVYVRSDRDFYIDDDLYNTANYCRNEKLMKQRALHETLNRLLWRFSMQNGGDELDWENRFQNKFVINFNYSDNSFFIENNPQLKSFNPCFISQEIVERAIDEIIKPFMKEHPDFVW